DSRQLLGPHVRLFNLRTNASLGPDELHAEWGIRPDQVVDFLALVGDSVDNVPGVPGIGPKIASELLQQHGTLDGVLAAVETISGAKRKENLRAYGDTARAGRELIRLDATVPLEIHWDAAALHPPDREALAELCRECGFRSLLDRVVQAGARTAAPPPAAKPRAAGTLFDLDGEEPAPAAAHPQLVVHEPRDATAIAAAVQRLRAGGSVTICVPLAVRTLGVTLAGSVFDTLLAAYLLEAGERNLGLVETAIRHGVPVGDPAAAAAVESPTGTADAARHCAVVQPLAARLPERLAAAGLADLFATVEMPLARILAAMEFRGVRIDTPVLAALATEYAARLATLETEIHALAGRPFAIASPLQLRAVLFDELGLPIVKRGKTGPSTDAEVLEQLAPLHPLPAKLLEHRRYAKLKSTYVDALPALVDPTTGRIHTTFNQTVTATGRLSSSEPNLQNIPIRTAEGLQIRAAFLPAATGWRFVAADYSQIELRILAHLSGDAAMQAAFAAGEDIHARTAAAVCGAAAADVTPAMRRLAKAVNFGILYGQSAFGLAKALGIPQADAAEFIAGYFRVFAGAAAFMDDVLDRCRRDGFVTTMLGRRRSIAGVRDRDRRRNAAGVPALTLPEREAVNTVVQGSAADLIKLAMLRVDARLQAEGRRAALVLQIHDELLLEAPPDEVAAVERLVADEMRQAMALTVPIEVAVHAGGTWAECE
ncbi:MAG: DNA polymerase, partial [Planctomycetaceae bacterium]|nr:DNA polymerase [Planctomycetaceae bacterium]